MKQQLTWHSHAQPTKYFEYHPVEFPHARWIMFLQMSSLYKFKRGFCNYWYGSLVLHFTPMYLVHVGNVFFAKSRPIHPSGALVLCINPTFVVDKIIRCITKICTHHTFYSVEFYGNPALDVWMGNFLKINLKGHVSSTLTQQQASKPSATAI